MSCHPVIFYILQHLITSPEGEKASKYSEGPHTGPLNGRETSEGWHTSCHWCHGSASHCFVRHNLTILAVSLVFWICQCWLLEWTRTKTHIQNDGPFLAQFEQINTITAGLFALLLQLICHKWMSPESQQQGSYFYTNSPFGWFSCQQYKKKKRKSSVEQTARLWHSLCVDKAENTAVAQSAWFRDVL